MSTMHVFKGVADSRDLRDVQHLTLWEWAVTSGLSLQSAAQRFAHDWRVICVPEGGLEPRRVDDLAP